MDAPLTEAFENLKSSLQELTISYENLLASVISEKQFLIGSKIDDLNLNNEKKETLLSEIKKQDLTREKRALSLARLLKMKPESARLLEIAKGLPSYEANVFRDYHQKLSELVERVVSSNKDNEVYAMSALKALGRAMDNVKDSLGGKKTYAAKGKVKEGPLQSGNFVSKEA